MYEHDGVLNLTKESRLWESFDPLTIRAVFGSTDVFSFRL